jgi:hypothetical protein
MTSSAAGTSRFARAIEDYGLARCAVSGATIWVGLGPDPKYRREPLEAVPGAPTSICFVEAPDQAELIAALAAGPEAATIDHLMIGTSHDYAQKRAAPYDMSAAVAALEGAQLPALRQLSLGDMELLFNGHAYYGRLGDVTHVFAVAPLLEELRLRGQFALSAPVRHGRLRELTAFLDDIGVSGGPLSQETVTRLLSSELPSLSEASLSLDEEEREVDYSIPDAFFTGPSFPALAAFAMDCLTPEADDRLAAWKAARGVRW